MSSLLSLLWTLANASGCSFSHIDNKNINHITEQSCWQFLICTLSHTVAAMLGEQDMAALVRDYKSCFWVKKASWGLRNSMRMV